MDEIVTRILCKLKHSEEWTIHFGAYNHICKESTNSTNNMNTCKRVATMSVFRFLLELNDSKFKDEYGASWTLERHTIMITAEEEALFEYHANSKHCKAYKIVKLAPSRNEMPEVYLINSIKDNT